MVSEPLGADRLAQVHWPDRAGFVEARNFIVFARLTADHRLLVGGGPAPYRYGREMGERHIFSLRAEQVLAAARDRFFPQWSDVQFTHAYGGCIAVTRDLVPHIGRLADGTCYGYGYCGNGIVTTQLAGRALRDIVLHRTSADTELLFVGGREPAYPPEPLSFLGTRALTAVLEFQDRHPRVVRRQLV
jgi:glycine/D-amino acid oxidase-like deaminating enzyme